MVLARQFREQLATVNISLVDSRTKLGRLARFDPTDAQLVLIVAAHGKGAQSGVAEERIPVSKVASVAFYAETHSASPPTGVELREHDVHVAGGRRYPVLLVPEQIGREPGMYGYPPSEHSLFSEIFFFTHGVNACQDRTPLGQMLVKEGLLDNEKVTAAVTEQQTAKAAQIGEILVEQRRVQSEQVDEALGQQDLQRSQGKRIRLGEVLVEAGLATPEDIDAALAEQKKNKGKRMGEVLVELGIVEERTIAVTLARKFHLEFVDLDALDVQPEAINEIPAGIVQRYDILPYKSDDTRLWIAMSDPLGMEALDMLRFSVQKRMIHVVVTPSQLLRYLEPYRVDEEEEQEAAADEEWDELIGDLGGDAPETTSADIEVEDTAAVSKLVNRMIADAHRRGASDIHVEPNGPERAGVIRYRIDGVCEVYRKIPAVIRAQIVARIKVMAQLDITEKRRPQDGKIRFRLGNRKIDLRIATLPTVTKDEDVVIRLLAGSNSMPVDKLGLSDWNKKHALDIVHRPYGLFLVVGPTGSGKTTTLHGLLGDINDDARKVWTAEDPVEIVQPGLRQVQVNSDIGFTFAAAMRSFLRADPDVIMVGEMRDLETAGTGVEASLTGHLVMSTLHTNTAPETVTRLVDMGLDPYTFSDALLGVLAQRLARRLCSKCREKYAPSAEERADIEALFGRQELAEHLNGAPLELWRGRGCEQCRDTGYKGRVGLHELLVNDDSVRVGIQKKLPAGELRKLATAAGMRTLVQDGIVKCLAGDTDLKQVLAVSSR